MVEDDMTVAERVREGLGRCSPAERRVGRALLAEYPAAGLDTVASLAERAGTSGPTVLRFLARLGFSGFPDFQEALRSELTERTASPLTILQADGGDASSPAKRRQRRADLLGNAQEVIPASVAHTLEQLPPNELSAAVELLADPQVRIVAEGGRFTRLLAEYLVRHLMQVRGQARLLPDIPVARADLLLDVGRRDVLVIFDFRRYEPPSKKLADRYAERGAKVILVTDRWLSPISSVADVVLPVGVDAISAYDSLVPALALVEVLIAGVLEVRGDGARKRMADFEQVSLDHGIV
nr:MurR/RpiR family transcriptional regulator [Nocardioides sp. MAH-18]